MKMEQVASGIASAAALGFSGRGRDNTVRKQGTRAAGDGGGGKRGRAGWPAVWSRCGTRVRRGCRRTVTIERRDRRVRERDRMEMKKG